MAKKRGHDDELVLVSTISPVVKRSRTTPPRHVVDIHPHRENGAIIAAETSSVTDTTSSSRSSSSDEISSEDGQETDQETTSSGSSASSSSPSSSSSENENGDETEEREARSEADVNNEPITFVSGQPRPRIKRVQGSGLFSRLSSFLPQLKAANEDLERDIATGRAQDVIMDDVQAESEEGQYIEMNLGLGVLEEKKSDNNDSDSESELGSEVRVCKDRRDPSTATQHRKSEETHVLDRLMGNEARAKRITPGIEEVDD